MTVTINFSGLDPITDALNNLAKAMGASGVTTTYKEPEKAPASQPVPQAAPVSQPTPMTAPQPTVNTPQSAPAPVTPVQQPTQVQQPIPASVPQVPTSAATYTLDDLGRAGMMLMDSGRQTDLLNLLAQFGVATLPDLPSAQYGAFATALRGLGAQI